MGYTHYWYRKEREIGKDVFVKIKNDFEKMIPEFDRLKIQLADGLGKGEPIINDELICFNGKSKCGHAKNEAISIPWPSEFAGGVAKGFDDNKESGHWFAGAQVDTRMCNGDCSYESFIFSIIHESKKQYEGGFFGFTKTAYRPYDLAVNCFLIIAKHHMGNLLTVKSDGDTQHWADGRILCQNILGYGIDFELDTEAE